MTHTAPFGSWRSPISSAALTSATVGLSEPRFDDQTLYWLESRPEEKGRSTIVRLSPEPDAKPETVLPHPINVRSKVNEYGGGSYCVDDGTVYFVLADDQRIYRLQSQTTNKEPTPLTPEGPWRYADLVVDTKRQRLLAICEDHSRQSSEPDTYVVSIPLSVSLSNQEQPRQPKKYLPETHFPDKLVSGQDFYSSLNLSADGEKLCWLSWNHPNMPWDSCECWVASFNTQGQIANSVKIAGSSSAEAGESIFQPQWSADGSLYYISDRSNWWNLYRHQAQGSELGPAQQVLNKQALKKNAEFASPQWVFGLSTYDFVDNHTLLCCYTQQGQWHLGLIDTTEGSMSTLETDLNDIAYLRCNRSEKPLGVFIAADPKHLPNLFRLAFNSSTPEAGKYCWPEIETIAHSSLTEWDSNFISKPETIQFPTGAVQSSDQSHQNAHAFFYPPKNANHNGPAGEKPPLIILCHGGPTAATHGSLNIKIQFWTSRGFAVADINYRGSTGYGRDYRQQLNGQWGVTDVEDAAAAVTFLASTGRIDVEKVAIKGSSAGGYTVLAALTFTNTFKAGASLYGIGDLETLAQDTHKFESRYMDTLVGPYPEQKQLYQQRSPIHSVDQLNCPVIFFQGLEDKVVLPNQAQTMVKALQEKHVPVAYVEFPEEGHGFRQAANIQRTIEAELYFYSKVFGFSLADSIEAVDIKNPENL